MADLLSLFATKAGCLYISDLPGVIQRKIPKEWVQRIPDNQYSLSQWNDSLRYLFRENIDCHSVQEAKKVFCKKLIS